MYSLFSMQYARFTSRGRSFARHLCLGILGLSGCTAEQTTGSTSSPSTRDAQTASSPAAPLEDDQDGGVVTRGAGMPIVPIHRVDAGVMLDAATPIDARPPTDHLRPDAEQDAGQRDEPGSTLEQMDPDAGNTLPPTAALPSPVHRFSFSGAGTTSPDLMGGAEAILRGDAALDGQGAVSFPAQGDGFVELPAGLLADSSSFTVLVWLSMQTEACGQRALELSDAPATGAGPLRTSLLLTPYDCPGGLPALGVSAGTVPLRLSGGAPIEPSTLVQLGLSFSARSQTLRLIVDGMVQDEQSLPLDARAVQGAMGTLGGANLGAPQLHGTITELRVYASRLTPQELLEVHTRGPDAL